MNRFLSISLITSLAFAGTMRAQNANGLIALTDQKKADPGILLINPAEADWSATNPKALVWKWNPGDSGIDSTGFGLPTEVKLRTVPAWGKGQWLAVSDSHGLIGVVSYPTKKMKWHIDAGKSSNVHGIEILPNGNVAAAASTGNWVRVYTASQGATSTGYAQFDFQDAHNVLWDTKRQTLWAVGGKDLIELKIGGTKDVPKIEEIMRIPLPTNGGHDLSPADDDDSMYVTTVKQVYVFHKKDRSFTLLQGTPNIKSINRNPRTGQLMETTPHASCKEDTWCTDVIDLLNPAGKRERAGAAVYRARLLNDDRQ